MHMDNLLIEEKNVQKNGTKCLQQFINLME